MFGFGLAINNEIFFKKGLKALALCSILLRSVASQARKLSGFVSFVAERREESASSGIATCRVLRRRKTVRFLLF